MNLEMSIKRRVLWSESIFETKLPEIDNRDILNYYQHLKSIDPGIQRSNVGGWQKEVGFGDCDGLDDMFDKITHVVNHIFTDVFKMDENLMVSNAWLNSNNTNHKNSLHTHPGCLFSGVYYVTGQNEPECGNINFCRDLAHSVENTLTISQKTRQYCFGEREKFWNTSQSLPAIESNAYLFAPWLVHEVSPNFTDTDRVVIGMNFVPSS